MMHPYGDFALPPQLGANYHASYTLTVTATGVTLPERPTRASAVLAAPSTNVASIVVESSGFPIAPGGTLTITASDLYRFTGTAGDLLYVYEEWV